MDSAVMVTYERGRENTAAPTSQIGFFALKSANTMRRGRFFCTLFQSLVWVDFMNTWHTINSNGEPSTRGRKHFSND